MNLDADGAHRVTLLADKLADGTRVIPNIDGSTWYPFSGHLVLTGEEAAPSGVTEGTVLLATPHYPSTVTKLDTVFGIAGWEGVQADSDGNLWLVADQGGPSGTLAAAPLPGNAAVTVNLKKARQPNSFVYRFVPANKADLTQGGKLQALQVASLQTGKPIVFTAGQPDADILSPDVKDLHSYGKTFKTAWVTVHDTAIDGFTVFDANAAAKAAGATPFKRPENGVFRPFLQPHKKFTEFYFTETGDTNDLSLNPSDPTLKVAVQQAYGAFGGVFKIVLPAGPSANTGFLSLVYAGDLAHGGFDNITFAGTNDLLVVEDAGDTAHTQRAALDSGYVLDVSKNYADPANQPLRFLAEGRDASATLDAYTAGLNSNGDNEITGIHVSDGDPSVRGMLGAKVPTPFFHGWRIFWTQQHGDNNLWEIVSRGFPTPRHGDDDVADIGSQSHR